LGGIKSTLARCRTMMPTKFPTSSRVATATLPTTTTIHPTPHLTLATTRTVPPPPTPTPTLPAGPPRRGQQAHLVVDLTFSFHSYMKHSSGAASHWAGTTAVRASATRLAAARINPDPVQQDDADELPDLVSCSDGNTSDDDETIHLTPRLTLTATRTVPLHDSRLAAPPRLRLTGTGQRTPPRRTRRCHRRA
jgi:hypothetical protein